MAKYKFGDEEGTLVTDTEKGMHGIHSKSRFWKDYEKWLDDGNVTDPWKTQEELDAEAKREELDQIDLDFLVAVSVPVPVVVDGITYEFAGGFESSLYIDNARQLADNLNESDVQLWDINGQSHIFSKAEANDIAIAVGLSFRTAYTAMKEAKKEKLNV